MVPPAANAGRVQTKYGVKGKLKNQRGIEKFMLSQVEFTILHKLSIHLLHKGSHPLGKVQFFLTLFKRPLTPPPPFV